MKGVGGWRRKMDITSPLTKKKKKKEGEVEVGHSCIDKNQIIYSLSPFVDLHSFKKYTNIFP